MGLPDADMGARGGGGMGLPDADMGGRGRAGASAGEPARAAAPSGRDWLRGASATSGAWTRGGAGRALPLEVTTRGGA
jgi:hypothetical protein